MNITSAPNLRVEDIRKEPIMTDVTEQARLVASELHTLRTEAEVGRKATNSIWGLMVKAQSEGRRDDKRARIVRFELRMPPRTPEEAKALGTELRDVSDRAWEAYGRYDALSASRESYFSEERERDERIRALRAQYRALTA